MGRFGEGWECSTLALGASKDGGVAWDTDSHCAWGKQGMCHRPGTLNKEGQAGMGRDVRSMRGQGLGR